MRKRDLKKSPIKRDKDALELGSLWSQEPRIPGEGFTFYGTTSGARLGIADDRYFIEDDTIMFLGHEKFTGTYTLSGIDASYGPLNTVMKFWNLKKQLTMFLVYQQSIFHDYFARVDKP